MTKRWWRGAIAYAAAGGSLVAGTVAIETGIIHPAVGIILVLGFMACVAWYLFTYDL